MRKAGVLLHISSLPGRYGIGTLGSSAYRFVDFLSEAGFSYWQVLPINPVGMAYSPYQSPASFRGNPMFVDFDILVSKGLLKEEELPPVSSLNYVDYPTVMAQSERILEIASERSGEDDFVEAEFTRQWDDLLNYAHSKGIKIIGDLPIYVAPNSEEVLANPELFLKREVAGCPPDAFSATGQRWNNPLYNWTAMAKDGYSFWINRMEATLKRFDLVRLDHFRGFAGYWAIPVNAPDATCGKWKKGPGMKLFRALEKKLGKLPLIAEDLGYITEDVHELRKKLELPGMAILQFAFDGDNNPYLPENIKEDCVCYTGTHDNNTTLGWIQEGGWHVDRARQYFNAYSDDALLDAMINACLDTKAQLAILPMQDLIRYGALARMNIPGVAEGNWIYQLNGDLLTNDLAREYRNRLERYNRI